MSIIFIVIALITGCASQTSESYEEAPTDAEISEITNSDVITTPNDLRGHQNSSTTQPTELTTVPHTVGHRSVENGSKTHEEHHSKWEEFGPFFTFTMFIVITGLTKVGFHHTGCLITRLPESCLLIVSGVAVGAIMQAMHLVSLHSDSPHDLHPALKWPLLPAFTPTLFFAVLLPPVILESAYSLYDRHFAKNIFTVLLYAVLGTLFNAFSIGLLLYFMYESDAFDSLQDTLSSDFSIKLTDFMLFGAVASAVDPVAVLAIFQDLSINKDLYFLVFGESLLNDAVTVALYSAMVTFTGLSKIEGAQYGEAVLRLFTAGVGGTLIGMLGGFLTALVTRATRNCRVVEPLAVLGLAYLTYLISELFHFSGIISIIICGLLQAHYAFKNISHKSYTTVKYFTKMISSTSDSAIFLFLGAELVGGLTAWHTTFAVSSIFLCLLCRYASIFALTALHNKVSERYVEMRHQIILGYGGLRGATCYALATMLDTSYPPSDLFSTTALAIVLFTVFVQGGTIKYLVQILKIEKLSLAKKTLNEEIMENVCNTMMAGLEEIASARGDYYLKRKLEILDEKYLKKIFLNSDVSNDLKHLFEKISIVEHASKMYHLPDQQNNVPRSSKSMSKISPENNPRDLLFMRRPVGQQTNIAASSDAWSLLGWRRPQSASPDILHEVMMSTPYQQFQSRYNMNFVADRPRELREELRLRRAANILLLRNRSRKRFLLQENLRPPSPDAA